jgi:hypothetical protein
VRREDDRQHRARDEGGRKASANFRAGPEGQRKREAPGLRRIVSPAIAAATKPSPTHVQSHPLPVSVAAASGAATSAVRPIAIILRPGRR